MATLVPPEQIQFAQLAASQRFVSPEQVRAAIDLYRRYEASGGEQPSMARILVGKGWLKSAQGQVLLRHLYEGAPLPVQNGAGAQMSLEEAVSVPMPISESKEMPKLESAEFEQLDDLGLEPPGSNIDLPVTSGMQPQPVVDERQALIKGLGATVMRPELREIKGYKITQVIGEGSMGIVYKAHQISMDRTVALKVLPAEKTKDQRFVDEFLTEARNTGRLNHPNLIRVHEVGKAGDTYYYSMEYVDGQRLDEWMDECEGGRLDPKEAVKVFVQIASALDYGFRAGVIHREIRPNAVLVGDDGQAKLSELGLVKDEHTRFLDGENACYVAPEQAKGMPVDTRSDVYSLGCCLFHCLTGEPPFQGGSPKEVLSRRLVAVTPDPRELNPDIPIDLANVVMKMMARDLKERFQTPAEVAESLKKISFGMSATTKKPLMNAPSGGGGGGMMKRPMHGHGQGHARPGMRRHGSAANGRRGAPNQRGRPKRYRP